MILGYVFLVAEAVTLSVVTGNGRPITAEENDVSAKVNFLVSYFYVVQLPLVMLL